MRIGPIEIALILVAVVAIFGTKNLPMFGKKAGEAVKDLKENSKEITEAIKAVKTEVKEIKEVVTIDLNVEENHV